MTEASVQALLKDRDTELMRDRRSVHRKPFVRPLEISIGRGRADVHKGFSRDISHVGIGTILPIEVPEGITAIITVGALNKRRIVVEAQSRWSESFGDGWFVTGWTFKR